MTYGLHIGGEGVPCACKGHKEHAGEDTGGPSSDDSLGVLPCLLLAAGVVVGSIAYRRHLDEREAMRAKGLL